MNTPIPRATTSCDSTQPEVYNFSYKYRWWLWRYI